MFNRTDKNSQASANGEHAVIIEGDFESGEEYGLPEERKNLQKLEDDLAKKLGVAGGEYDGDDIGEGTFTIYCYGENADELFEVIEPILRESEFNYLQITKRYGLADDTNAIEKKFTL